MRVLLQTRLLVILTLCMSTQVFAVNPGLNWKDSYSVNGQCYCDTTYDHETADIIVETPAGNRTVKQICETIGPGPGAGNNPVYNDVQCGHGPPNNAIDEVLCPGRVDSGSAGCQVKGPTWNLELYFAPPVASESTGPDSGVGSNPNTATGAGATDGTNTQAVDPDNTEENPGAEESTDAAPENESEQIPTNNANSTDEQTSTTQTDEFIPTGIVITARDFSSKDNRWALVEPTNLQTGLGPDPDGPHIDTALNASYLELLPDTKVSKADQAASDNVWPVAGEGPQVHFDVTFEQAGRYAVYVRAYSTGDYDDTVHVGFDGLWPDSGANVNTCGVQRQWTWTKCADSAPNTISIPSSGVHSIQFSARDDGFEFDQFVLQRLDDVGVNAATQTTAEATSGLAEQQASNSEQPELGKAVLVGGGSIAFGNGAVTLALMLLCGIAGIFRRQ